MRTLSIHPDLQLIKEKIYDTHNLVLTKLILNPECTEYGACSFSLNGKMIEHRVSKVTPTKIGQFVTIWKRNKEGITRPYDISDEMDFIIITARSGNNIGQFILPKSVLSEKGIISNQGKGGKRGIRVYPPWDVPTNKQAIKTQNWQIKYFLTIAENISIAEFYLRIT